jgi:hypothetical protein
MSDDIKLCVDCEHYSYGYNGHGGYSSLCDVGSTKRYDYVRGYHTTLCSSCAEMRDDKGACGKGAEHYKPVITCGRCIYRERRFFAFLLASEDEWYCARKHGDSVVGEDVCLCQGGDFVRKPFNSNPF